MTTEEVRELIYNGEEYKFLWNHPELKGNMCLLAFGGSYAYGTNNEGSDIDIRGIALNSKTNILLNNDFEQVIDNPTDTTIYSINKMIHLLCQCNPNCIEILGCKPEHYFYVTVPGHILLENKEIFLSKRCINTFGGYAISQLRRLENISNKYVDQSQQEKHILDTIEQAAYTFRDHYYPYNDGSLKLYIDKAVNEDLETEIFIDTDLKHYPLRDYTNLWNELKSIVSSYNRLGKRNQRALNHKKIGKHMMHLIRLYMMCIDILEKHEIITYREDEHDLLMDIRNGKFLDENEQPTKEFSELVDEYTDKLDRAAEKSTLPDHPDMNEVNRILYRINEAVVYEKKEI